MSLSSTRGWVGSTTQNTPGATPLPIEKSTTPRRERTPPWLVGQSTAASSSRDAFGPVHAGAIRHEARGIGEGDHLDHGLGAVDELDEHARVHVARAGLRFISLRDGLDVEGVVLALSGGDHGQAEGAREGDELDGRRGLVSRRTGVDDPGALGPRLQKAPDRDVGLDIEHDHVLAVADRGERDLRPGLRMPRRVDDDLDPPRSGQHVELRGHGDATRLDRAIDGRRACGLDDVARANGRRGAPHRRRSAAWCGRPRRRS